MLLINPGMEFQVRKAERFNVMVILRSLHDLLGYLLNTVNK